MAPVTTTTVGGLDRRQIPGLPGVTIPGLTLPIPGFPGFETGSTSTTASSVTTTTVLPTTTTPTTTTTTTETTISSTSTVPTISTPTALPTSTPDPEPTIPPPSTPSFPPVLPTVTTPSTTFSTPSASSTTIGNTKDVPTKGFFANTAAVTATFTILGVIVAAVFLYFLTMTLRRRRVKRLERDIAEAAAIQAGFGGDFTDDDDRRPFGASGVAAGGAGSSSLTSHPSMRTAHSQPISTGPSGYGNPYSGYTAQPQSQARYSPPSAYAGGYTMQPPRTTTPPRHDEPDVYAYNSGASSDSGHAPAAATMAGVGAQGAGGYGSAMVPGISRYAQMQATAQPPQLNRAQSTRKGSMPTPPPPVATPMRKDSAISVQVGGYDSYRDHAVATDLKVVNS